MSTHKLAAYFGKREGNLRYGIGIRYSISLLLEVLIY